MRYKTYPRYKSFDFANIWDKLTEPKESYEQTQARLQLLRDQLAKSEQELSDRLGEARYREWRAAMIRPLDDPGEVLAKVGDQLARLTCGDCPFDYDPGMCGVCHEHGLGVK
jgi:hypothetical protein